jgi:hypothetical protein
VIFTLGSLPTGDAALSMGGQYGARLKPVGN